MEYIYRCHPKRSHLHHALEGAEQVPGHVELARVLLEHGADVNAQDNKRHMILYWAL